MGFDPSCRKYFTMPRQPGKMAGLGKAYSVVPRCKVPIQVCMAPNPVSASA